MSNYFSLIVMIFVGYPYLLNACNPNQNCMTSVYVPCGTFKKPFRTCRRQTEDTLCATARKACQVSCSNTNKDASNYITQYYSEINRINSELSVIQSSLASEQLHLTNYTGLRDDLKQSFIELTSAYENGTYLIDKQSKLEMFIVEYKLENKDVNLIILLAKASNDPEIILLGELLERASAISSKTEDFFNSSNVGSTLKSISVVFKTEINHIDREYQRVLQLINETDKNIKQMNERMNNKTNELVTLQSRISEQEARKCTPW